MTHCIENQRDPVCQQELESIAASNLNWEAFRNRTVLVTGATGLVGSYAVRALAAVNRFTAVKCVFWPWCATPKKPAPSTENCWIGAMYPS